MTDQKTISGRVTSIGYYQDTLPKLVITFSKDIVDGISIRNGERKQLSLTINGETYLAGIRTTIRSKNITISPDLFDATGNQIRLADLLLRNNIQKNTTVELSFDNGGIILCIQKSLSGGVLAKG